MVDKGRKVYIIESPAPMDILEGRKEGNALNEILSLAQIQNQYYTIVDYDTLLNALAKIAADVNNSANKFGLIDLHFSMHGDKEGICLTNGAILTWQVLYETLKMFNTKVGYVNAPWAPGKMYSPANLNFSVCEGFYAVKMKEFSDASPYTAILGPTQPVHWADSLIAFATYYHLSIHKRYGWLEACHHMNVSAGLKNTFKLQMADGLSLEDIPHDLLPMLYDYKP